jgi:cytochrome b561
MIRNDSQTWGSVARALHWSIAALIGIQLCLGWIGGEMARSPAKVNLMTAHKSLGLTVLALVVLRILWRWANVAPQPPERSPRWEILAAKASHLVLYLLLVAVPLSGWVAASTSAIPWKFWWLAPLPNLLEPQPDLHEVAGEVHEALVTTFLVVLGVHVVAALRHHFLQRDRVLMRMWRG